MHKPLVRSMLTWCSAFMVVGTIRPLPFISLKRLLSCILVDLMRPVLALYAQLPTRLSTVSLVTCKSPLGNCVQALGHCEREDHKAESFYPTSTLLNGTGHLNRDYGLNNLYV